jgi:transcriptional regulator with XRE-family HTH domain
MRELDEKQAFAERLKQALKRSPKKIDSATELSVQFSLRHPNASVTPQAAQKWLSGKAKPTVDKIDTLAEWLGVSAQWLRHGVTDELRPVRPKAKKSETGLSDFSADEIGLVAKLRLLPEARRQIVVDIVEQFALDAESWFEP